MADTTPSLDLEELDLDGWPFSLLGIAYGQGSRLQLEVLYSKHDRTPGPTQLRSAWRARQGGRGVPLLVIVLHDGKAHVCGPSGEDPTVYPNLDAGQVERICQEALEQNTRQAALRSLRDSLGSLEEEGLPGLRNEGFLASHELIRGVPTRRDWKQAKTHAREILGHTGKKLLGSLGFTIEPLDNVTSVLKAGDRKSAVAILLSDQETPESGSQRIPGTLSPVSYALARADEENLDWVVLVHGRKIRLYPVKMGVGVGRRGRTETFLECHTGLIPDDQAAYLWLLFSADALTEDGSLNSIISDSKDFAGDLASRLRERIYDQVVPRLAEGLAEARGIKKPTAQDLAATYQMAMRVLFRLLFIAYGEDKDLLPYRFNGLYQKRSLKAKARELLNIEPDQFDESDSWWMEVQNIFKAVDKGNRDWGVPAYNGGLFSSDSGESEIGHALSEVSLPNHVFGPALQHLLLVPTSEGALGPVDFRSLGVREFGTIYEGLLESELSVAETDLTVETRGKNKDAYRPCKDGEEPVVAQGAIYLHNASGARKATGSYYTKHFAVEHLLDRSLEPALDDHFSRLNDLEELEAAESFFDFRVADIAMGSGHFLVASVDRIEARFSRYLANRSLPQVAQELSHLRKAAVEALGDSADSYPEFEDTALLRRLIARRCIYGVDINEVAVQLARLGIWIHTFVPGLPLSLLDRNLIHGNSLVGVGQLNEFNDVLQDSGMTLFQMDAKTFLGDAAESLTRLGRIADATKTEIQQARKAWQEADAAIEPTRALCDILAAARIEAEGFPILLTNWKKQMHSVAKGKDRGHALGILEDMHTTHFPVAFPEVFLRERAGFDVILGNPPWEEATLEEDAFWARHYPGLRSLPQREQEALKTDLRKDRPDLLAQYEEELATAESTRRALVRGPFPGMGTGDPDLYKAFCWRFWFLVAEKGGRIGVVLPRSVLAAKGSEEFRWTLFGNAKGVDATLILNNRNWFFEDVHPQYTVGLVAIERNSTADDGSSVYLEGPYSNRASYDSRLENGGASFVGEEVLGWNDSASLPLLPTVESVEVFAQLRKAPRLDLDAPKQWRAKPHTELHATNDKTDKKTGQVLMDLVSEDCPEGFWPVYKGESFDLWEPDTETYYAWGDVATIIPRLQAKRARGNRLQRSVFYECDADWCGDTDTLPCFSPRIAFRDISRATDSRTMRCTLVPPEIFIANQAPYFVFPRGGMDDSAYLLGVLSSTPLDWYARRFVETHVSFFVLNPFPIPRPASDNTLRLRVVELAGRLACPDDRFVDWAEKVGVECGPLEEGKKQDMIHELDAVVAQLYGLTQDHLVHVFETFHVGWDYHDRLDATLQHYRTWEKNA
jgi:Eco57I restriction-modification methylase